MEITKENSIFNLNNILLSAYKNDKDMSEISELSVSENESLIDVVDKDLVQDYKNIQRGILFELESENESDSISNLFHKNNSALAFGSFAKLLRETPDNIELMKKVSMALLSLKGYETVLKIFVPKFLSLMDNDSEMMEIVAGTYFSIPSHYADAIPLYEKLLELYPDGKRDYNYRLSFMYERVYQDKKIDTQIKYAKRALKDGTDKNLVYSFLAKLYYRRGDKKECKKYLDKMMKNKPNCENIVSYSRFLMKEGEITKAYDLYRCRFDTGNVAYPDLLLPEKRWDGKKDLSESTVIIHYEQGFGDSVMFSRYIPDISKLAKKVIFVVQKNLIPLFKSSGFENYCEILSHEADVNVNIVLPDSNRSVMYSTGKGMGKIQHDYHIPLMDSAYLMKESPSKMIHSAGYLKADENKVKEFREKYINDNNKIKVGLAYHGTKESILTYRDISVKKFLPLLKMKGVECYSFQADSYAKEIKELDDSIEIIDLGQSFKTFEDTACAIECMDVIVSTDNVVMNLAGAMGKKTYGLFNVFSESRWYKTEGNDVGWYKSVRPFRAKTFNDWDNLMLEVKKALEEDFCITK